MNGAWTCHRSTRCFRIRCVTCSADASTGCPTAPSRCSTWLRCSTSPRRSPLLTGVTGLGVEAALDDAEAAVASSLLIEDPASGGFLLSHDLVRQTLEEMLSDHPAGTNARPHRRGDAGRGAGIANHAPRGRRRDRPPPRPRRVGRRGQRRDPLPDHRCRRRPEPVLLSTSPSGPSAPRWSSAPALPTPPSRAILQFELRTRLVLQSNVISGPPGSRIFGRWMTSPSIGE